MGAKKNLRSIFPQGLGENAVDSPFLSARTGEKAVIRQTFREGNAKMFSFVKSFVKEMRKCFHSLNRS
jgi:hypothetical protein